MKYSLKVVYKDCTVPTQVLEGTLTEVVAKAEELDAQGDAVGYYIQKVG